MHYTNKTALVQIKTKSVVFIRKWKPKYFRQVVMAQNNSLLQFHVLEERTEWKQLLQINEEDLDNAREWRLGGPPKGKFLEWK